MTDDTTMKDDNDSIDNNTIVDDALETDDAPKIDDTPKIDWEKIRLEETPSVHAEFRHPNVPVRAQLHEHLQGPCDTAYFDFFTNQTHLSLSFLEKLVHIGKRDPQTAFRGSLKHEWGHYADYPRECSILMYLGHIAKDNFKKYDDDVLAYWCDIKDNLMQMTKKFMGKDVREMYKGMYMILEKDDFAFSEKDKKILQGADIDPEEIKKIFRDHSIDRLLTAYYQKQTEEDFGVDLGEGILADKLEKVVLNADGKPIMDLVTARDKEGNVLTHEDGKEKKEYKPRKEGLMSLGIIKKETELLDFMLFGTIIQEILTKRDELLEPYKKKLGQTYGYIIADKTGGHHDTPTLGDFPTDKIQEGLDEIIRKYGKGRYEKILKYVEDVTGQKFDIPRINNKGGAAGLAHSKITINDDQVPYYERKSRTYGLYVHEKPLIVDVFNSYPEGVTKFRVGDPVRTLDPYSSGGEIMPSITKRKKLRQGTKKDKKFKVPDLTIWLDTSGSMRDPKQGSDAVLAAFVLANNYWKNDASVGVVNFSADMACLLPGRELDPVYSLLCSYWGGGTVLNMPKIKEYMKRIAFRGHGLAESYFTTEQDYEEMIRHMPEDQRKEFINKHIEVNLDSDMQQKAVKEVYEKMDTCIITDGDIYNLPEVIGYINGMSTMTRNIVFLINNPRTYEQWKTLVLPNTQIIPVEKPSDLLGLSIGEVKNLVPPDTKPTSLFYK